MPMLRLLILACSQRKRPTEALLPAIDRYDGPTFRVVRRFFRDHPADSTVIAILSARFGLIGPRELIPDYDQRMTPSRARDLAPGAVREMERMLATAQYSRLLLCVGRAYQPALTGYETLIPQGTIVRVADGGTGGRLAELYDWLHEEGSEPLLLGQQRVSEGAAWIRGRQVTGTPQELLAVARHALAEGVPGASHYHAWYVPVDGRSVGPKWLVSQLTGLPASAFVTDEARRVLAQLGIEVRRV